MLVCRGVFSFSGLGLCFVVRLEKPNVISVPISHKADKNTITDLIEKYEIGVNGGIIIYMN
jgi:hypothetical protein